MSPKRLFVALIAISIVSVNGSLAQRSISLSGTTAVDPALRVLATELESKLATSKALTRPQPGLEKVLASVSDTVEGLSTQGDYELARQLYQAKLETAVSLFGPHSAEALDALQDGIFLATQQKDDARFKQLLGQYAAYTARMRAENKEDIIQLAEKQRKRRLQSKLDASLSTLFQPLK
jgi:hypothetical protein